MYRIFWINFYLGPAEMIEFKYRATKKPLGLFFKNTGKTNVGQLSYVSGSYRISSHESVVY